MIFPDKVRLLRYFTGSVGALLTLACHRSNQCEAGRISAAHTAAGAQHCRIKRSRRRQTREQSLIKADTKYKYCLVCQAREPVDLGTVCNRPAVRCPPLSCILDRPVQGSKQANPTEQSRKMATDTVSNYHLRTDALRIYLEGLFPGQRLEIREVTLFL